MSFRLRDRLAGAGRDHPEDSLFQGQYLILHADDSVLLNGQMVRPGDYFVPRAGGNNWTLRLGPQARSWSGRFRSGESLVDREYESLLELGELLQIQLETQPEWEEWIRVAPLVPRVSDKARITQRDRTIEEHLPHLQEVCRHPAVHIKRRTERLPVSRARRIPSQAAEYLAAHPEDWQYRKLQSVVPKRILAVTYDDEVDIYENRVAASLAEKLDEYLRGRIAQLRKIRAQGETNPALGTPRRNDRVYSLFAEGIGEEAKRASEATLIKLLALHRRVCALFDSPLCRAIPHQARTRVPSTLRATNIFVNDRHYRYVGMLWREFAEPSESVADYYEKMQRLYRGFDLFCVLLVCRAFEQLGFTSALSGAHLKPGKVLKLRGPGGESVSLAWKLDYTLAVKVEDEERIRFIPLVSPLSAGSEEEIESFMRALIPSDTSGHRRYGFNLPQRIVLYPGDSSQRESLPINLRLRIQSIGNDLRNPATTGLVPVSTYEVDSVERVARVVQWRLVGRRMLSYPPETWIPVRFAEDLYAVAPWLSRAKGRDDAAHVLRFPRTDESNALRQWFDAKSQHYRRQGRDGQHRVEQLERFQHRLQSAYAYLRRLLHCPVCHQTAPEECLRPRGDHSFVCNCSHCGSSWRMNTCGECGRPYPVLEVASVPPDTKPRRAGWVNQVLGRDVLAVPCWLPGSEGSYICPWCGVCRNEDRVDCDRCPRCTAQPSAWS